MDFHDFRLTASTTAAHSFPADGNYIRYLSVSSGADAPEIWVSTDSGHKFPLKPGQGVRIKRPASRWTLKNRAGTAAIVGEVLIADADEALDDDRITGEVSVIDASVSNVLAGLSYLGWASCGAVIAEYAHVQLKCPAASTKRAIVTQLWVRASGACGIRLASYQTDLTTFQQYGESKLFAAATAPSSAQCRSQSNAARLGTVLPWILSVPAGVITPITLKDPIVLTPGNGLLVLNDTVNLDLGAVFEFNERTNA